MTDKLKELDAEIDEGWIVVEKVSEVLRWIEDQVEEMERRRDDWIASRARQ